MRALEELQAPDERTQHFTPYGLSMGMLTPEETVAYQQEVLACTDLVDDVAEGTRNSFERLRTVYVYGVLHYEMFTVAEELARLVIEQALQDRFMEHYKRSIPFVSNNREE